MIHLKEGRSRYETRTFSVVYLRRAMRSHRNAATLVDWLNICWQPIRQMLDEWTVSDLATTYRHRFRGVDYEVSRQWTLWRILSQLTLADRRGSDRRRFKSHELPISPAEPSH